MPWAEIIKLLLPIIIELIGNKKKAGASMNAVVACWSSPQGRCDFVREACSMAESRGLIAPDQKLDIVMTLAEKADNPLAPLFIEYLYEMSDA